MRALRIDFVESSTPLWLWRGVAALLVVAAIVALVVETSASKALHEIRETQSKLKSQMAAAQVTQQPIEPTLPRRLLLAEQLLGHDWNELFTFLESVDLPGSRLVSLQSGVEPTKSRTEYRVDTWAEVVSLNEQLNADPAQRWELVSVSATDRGGAGGLTAIWEH